MNRPLCVLYVDDSRLDRELVRDALEKQAEGFRVVEAASRNEFEQKLALGGYNLVLSDFNILGFQGLQVISAVQERHGNLPVVIITGTGSEEVAVEALKRGAADYILKTPQSFRRLPITLRTVIDRALASSELHRLDRELRAVSKCNQVLVRAEDEQVLLGDICQIICGEAGYRLAWVGYAEHDSAKSIRPIKWAGTDEAYVQDAHLSWSQESERGRGPAGFAIRTGETSVVQDFADPRMAPWREGAERCGLRSAVSLPLKGENGEVFGSLNIYATDPAAFTLQEIRLLEELAGDVAFGITTARNRQERRRMEEQLRALNEDLEERVKRRTEELERANEKLEDLDRLKSLFIASMSHEFRTPLNSVIGFSSVLLNEWTGSLSAEQKDLLAIILRSGRHLLALVSDVIDVSKIEAGKLEPVREDFDAYDAGLEAISALTGDAQKKNLPIEFRGCHQTMYADRRRLLQCLLNLIGNAVKYTDQGKVEVEVRVDDSGDFVEFWVVDTGIGIGAEDREKLFSPFVRIVLPQRPVVPGTGLGLYLSRRLAQGVLGGDIFVQSVPGEGSRFLLKVPVAPRRPE